MMIIQAELVQLGEQLLLTHSPAPSSPQVSVSASSLSFSSLWLAWTFLSPSSKSWFGRQSFYSGSDRPATAAEPEAAAACAGRHQNHHQYHHDHQHENHDFHDHQHWEHPIHHYDDDDDQTRQPGQAGVPAGPAGWSPQQVSSWAPWSLITLIMITITIIMIINDHRWWSSQNCDGQVVGGSPQHNLLPHLSPQRIHQVSMMMTTILS